MNEIDSRGNAYPNLATHCSYGGERKISADAKDSSDVSPAVKRRKQRRGQRSPPASAGDELRFGEDEGAMEKGSAGGVDCYLYRRDCPNRHSGSNG